jgi:hypothetical protein
MLDTLKLAKRMEAAGLAHEQAEAIAEGLNEGLKESYISREYLDSRLEKLRSELIWSTILIVGIFDGILFFLLKK